MHRIASDGLKGRVYEVSLADLNSENDAERSFRKFKLVCEDVQGKNCLTNFYGMNLTTDKLRSMVKKWQTLIEAFADVKTTDGFLLRVFCIGFTQKQTSPGSQQIKKTCYAKAQQVSEMCKTGVVLGSILNRRDCLPEVYALHDDMPNPFSEHPFTLS